MLDDDDCDKQCANARWPEVCRFFCSIGAPAPLRFLFAAVDQGPPADKLLAEKLQQLQDELTSPDGQAQPTTVFAVAEAFRKAGMHEPALWATRAIPKLISNTDAAQTRLLAQALQSKARSLEALERLEEAESAFALAGHLYTLAGQIQR